MSEWGEWRADVKVIIWWMAISVVSGELLALAMREIALNDPVRVTVCRSRYWRWQLTGKPRMWHPLLL